MKMRADLSKKILLIDESWSLLGRAEEASYIFEIVKTCRKFNLGLLLINQEVEGLFTTNAGKSVLANSAYTLLMRQKPAVINHIIETFHLSESEKQHLLTCGIGEGLLIMEDDHSKIKVIASPSEHSLITQKYVETAEPVKVVMPKNVNVDLENRFYRKKQLNKDEIEYLIKKGYKEANYKSVCSGKKEDFVLKPRHNESLKHLFVTYDIAEFLEKKNISVQKYTTQKPDLVFEINEKTYAIEVETGKVMSNMKKFRQKVKLLKENYGENWFFVIITRNVTKKYQKFGEAIDYRFINKFLEKLVKKATKK